MANANQQTGRTLPKYNDALGDFLRLPAQIPQTYTDVLTQVYPLPADISALKTFCGNFLNQQEPCAWIFEPAAPWVVMQVCNYGKIAMTSQNVGWVSQHEFAFGFPVAWYEKGKNGERKFMDWAMVYPYIWVDDPLSMSLGRQVYGWAKAGIVLNWPRPNLEPNTRSLVSIDLKGGPGGSGVDDQTRPRFLEILQHQPVLSGRSGFATLSSLPARIMGTYLSAASGMLGTFNSMISGYQERLSGYANTQQPLQGLIRESANLTGQTLRWNNYLEEFLSGARDLTLAQERVLGMPVGSDGIEAILRSTAGKVRIITQKQVRDAACPDDAGFSALVGSTIKYSQPIDGGLLLSDPLSPDSSGGIQICLRDDFGIVGSLGLKHLDSVDNNARWSVRRLRPVMPFWVKLNMSYDSADCQTWRTRGTDWAIDYRSPEPDPPSGGGASLGQPQPETRRSSSRIEDADKLPRLEYIPWGSGASQEIAGPMKAANFGLWVYGLEADGETLKALCNEYLNQAEGGQSFHQFEVSPPSKGMAS